ncbi:MAG: S49 family peptidase [Planctomycetaceae bacterium]
MNGQLWAIADAFLPLPKIGDLAALAPKKPKPNRVPVETPNGIAVVDIKGVLTRDGSDWFSGSSYRDITEAVNRLAADSSIRRIVLRIDSPGGTVRGVHEAADAIYRHRSKITAIIDGYGSSAAYWLASQASMVYATRGSLIGSVGTRMSLIDSSELFKRIGLRVVSIATSDVKAAGEPGTEITPKQESYFASLTAATHFDFTTDIVRGRGFKGEALGRVNDGRVHVARDAKALGLIDGIQSFDDFLASFGPIVSQADKLAAQHAAHIRIPLARGQY